MAILGILGLLVWLANLVLGIIVLVKLYQKEGIVKAILGFICMLYTFIWGWMNAKGLNITNIMWAWTACLIVAIILQVVVGATSVPQMPQ